MSSACGSAPSRIAASVIDDALGFPFLLYGIDAAAWATVAGLLGAGIVLTVIFTGIATSISVRCEDRLRGLGTAIGSWLLLTVVYDGIVLFILAVMSDDPLERATVAMMMANPIDIARVGLLMRFDTAAMMGYTGAVFLKFFGGTIGMAVTITALTVWVSAPIAVGMRVFQRKDF